MGLTLCVLAFVVSVAMSRRSMGRGLGWVLLVGCLSGWIRCRVYDGFSHLVFDAALGGAYLRFFWARPRVGQSEPTALDRWVLVLIALPALVLLASPFTAGQPFLVQLVGLRSFLLFVPMLAVASRLTDQDLNELGGWAVASTLVVTGFAVGELAFGIETFFPLNAASASIYDTFAIPGKVLRIPASFASAHLYGGTLVALIPLIWKRLESRSRWPWLSVASLLCAASAAFICSTRVPVMLLGVLLFTALVVVGRRNLRLVAALLLTVVVLRAATSTDERFQRYETLGEQNLITQRVRWSVNHGLLDIIFDAPFGRGLASAAGTSIPYFLADQALPQEGLESEVSRLSLELGVIGLLIWLAFMLRWIAAGYRAARTTRQLSLALMFALAAGYAATGMIGVGVLNAIPATLIVFVQIGWLWINDPASEPARVPRSADAHPQAI